MKFDLMAGSSTWTATAELARRLEEAGFSGMLFTEAGQVPWMMIAAAATAASTGIKEKLGLKDVWVSKH